MNAGQHAATVPSFDVIVVGGGAAGCVLASRLSERSSCRVLLLEAGRDFAPGAEPADILDIYPSSYYNKDYMSPGQKAFWRTRQTSAAVGFDQGWVIGGGSSVMGMVALRGLPDDYDAWEQSGAQGWGWRDVLPYFRKLETDADFPGAMYGPDALHGTEGPVPIRRIDRAGWTPVARAAQAYAEARQIPFVADMNGDDRDGYCALPMSNSPQRRASSALCYLTAAVRQRPNLTITGSARVTELLFDGNQVAGVSATIAGTAQQFRARETILCAGALQSPAVLMRAGIGPPQALQDHGITVRAARPGVGENLQNHPVLFIGAHLRPAARQPASLRTLQVSCFRFSSGLPGCPPTDMFLHLQSKSSWNALGAQIANFGPVLWKPLSRGRVTLASAAPQDAPVVEFNFADDPVDVQRLALGFRRMVDLLGSPEMRPLMGTPFPVRFSDRLRLLNRRTTGNAVRTAMLARLLDLAPMLGGRVLARLTGGAGDLPALCADDAALAEHVRRNVGGTFHIAGTCRMGADTDPRSVVDRQGRVIGIGGLLVADASIMPNMPRGNTYVPTVMIAEKLAAMMASE